MQHQGTLAPALLPPLAHLGLLLQDTAAVGLPAQEETESDVSTLHRHA